eukprot:4940077-Ditylum_brightwellii.AAC.1
MATVKHLPILQEGSPHALQVATITFSTEGEIIWAYDSIHLHLKDRGLTPQFQLLDNEASAAIQANLTNKKVNFQLAPPNIHQQNAAECAIRTFKNHFNAVCAALTHSFHSNYGTDCYPKPSLH